MQRYSWSALEGAAWIITRHISRVWDCMSLHRHKDSSLWLVFEAKVVKKKKTPKNRRNCIRLTRFNSSNLKKKMCVISTGAAFSAEDNASTSCDPEWVKVEPAQALNTTNIKAEWASGDCCVLCSGRQKKKKISLRDAFACHYMEIAAWPQSEEIFKECFDLFIFIFYRSETQHKR